MKVSWFHIEYIILITQHSWSKTTQIINNSLIQNPETNNSILPSEVHTIEKKYDIYGNIEFLLIKKSRKIQKNVLLVSKYYFSNLIFFLIFNLVILYF